MEAKGSCVWSAVGEGEKGSCLDAASVLTHGGEEARIWSQCPCQTPEMDGHYEYTMTQPQEMD